MRKNNYERNGQKEYENRKPQKPTSRLIEFLRPVRALRSAYLPRQHLLIYIKDHIIIQIVIKQTKKTVVEVLLYWQIYISAG